MSVSYKVRDKQEGDYQEKDGVKACVFVTLLALVPALKSWFEVEKL